MTDLPPARRASRFWLYAPFTVLALAAIGWAAFWFHVRGRIVEALDQGLVRERQAGRDWTCADRSVTGFPFRVELRCASVTLTSSRWGEMVKLQAGPSVAVGQIYSPNLAILEVAGPLTATLPAGRQLNLGWSRLQASLAGSGGEVERVSLVVDAPNATLSTPGFATDGWKATSLEAHLRRTPSRPASDQAVDLAINTKGSALPMLDGLLGSTEPGDVDLQTTITQTAGFQAGFNPDALEAWRNAGGVIELTRLISSKGAARIDASGRLMLDASHRIAGQIDAAVGGIDRIAGIRIGGGLAAGLGGLFGGKPPAANAAPGLTSLPPVVLREGRVYLGPLRLPLQPLMPLY